MWVLPQRGLAAHRSKANKEARLVERKVCFILDPGNWGWGRADVCPKANPPHNNQGARALIGSCL